MTALRCKLLLNKDGSLRLEPLKEDLDSFPNGGFVDLEGEEAEAPQSAEEKEAADRLAKAEKDHEALLARKEADLKKKETRKRK